MSKIPEHINAKILSDIKKRLKPDLKYILAKLFGIHTLTTIITLAICPQFGFQFFKTSLNLMHYFMKFGQHFCDFACGTFFTATSFFIALFIISRDELRVLKYNKFLAISSIILTSIGFFAIMSPTVFFELSLLWILGATMGASLALEIGIRLQLVKYY
jgi:hypothetical protein